MPRRVSLPGAEELFRTTGGMALQPSTPRQQAGGESAQAAERLRPVPAPAAEPEATAATAGAEERPEAPRTAPAPEKAPAAAEHTRPTGAETAPAPPAPRRQEPEHPAQAPGQPQPPAQARRRTARNSPNRRPSGRERHDEKITVYVSAEELMDLEHARLVLRGEHGLAVDRGRIVREAVAVVLADLESRGDASILVRRLRGR